MEPLLGLIVAILATVTSASEIQRKFSQHCLHQESYDKDTIHDYSAREIWTNESIPFSKYRGKQEPGKNATEIMNGIKYVRPGNNFVPNFQMFAKIEVNGNQEHPLYSYLKRHCPPTRDGFQNKYGLYYEPIKNWDIRWNFEKILVNRLGRPVIRYDPSSPPEDIDQDIHDLINHENN